MDEQAEISEKSSSSKSRIPLWACLLIVTLVTTIAFVCFGGANYIQNQDEIDARYWRRADDLHNWIQWAFYLTDIGVFTGFLGFIGSTAVVIAINRNRQPGKS